MFDLKHRHSRLLGCTDGKIHERSPFNELHLTPDPITNGSPRILIRNLFVMFSLSIAQEKGCVDYLFVTNVWRYMYKTKRGGGGVRQC